MTTHTKEDERFFFNLNVFDEGFVEKEPELEEVPPPPPPPPTFTEEDLASAREEGFKEGHAQALEEAKKSQEHETSKILEKIAHDTGILFTEEHKREERYEYESVQLALSIFKKLFPLYQEHFGFAELKDTLSQTLRKQSGQKDILIRISPDFLEPINKHLQDLKNKDPALNFIVNADESLSSGAYTLSWKDGGAVKNTEALAEEIKSLMQRVLAPNDSTGHDRSIDNEPDYAHNEHIGKLVQKDEDDKNNDTAQKTDEVEKL